MDSKTDWFGNRLTSRTSWSEMRDVMGNAKKEPFYWGLHTSQ